MVQVVLPNDANPLGFILGGTVMHLIDIAGAIACHRHTRSLLVTAAVDDLQFLHPIKVGDLIILKSRVTCAFTTSLEVQVDVFSEETLTGRTAADEPRVPDFVAITRDGARVPVPPLLVSLDERDAGCDAVHRRGDARLRRKRTALSVQTQSVRRPRQTRQTPSAAARCVRGRCRRGTCSGTCGRRCRRARSRAARSARPGSGRRPGSSCS